MAQWSVFCYNTSMKKLLFLTVLFLLGFSAFAAESEPLLLINPSRETFIHFPTAVLEQAPTVTVFLPEPAVPLRGRYPVVYLLGVGPQAAQAAQQALARAQHKAILVGVQTEEKAWNDPQKISTFFGRELLPYIELNYPTIDHPTARGVAAQGAAYSKALAALLQRKDTFARAAVLDGGETPVSLAGASAQLRMWVGGTRAQAVVWQQTLLEQGSSYGPGFVLSLAEGQTLPGALDLDYLFAPAAELKVKKLRGEVFPEAVSLSAQERATLALHAQLSGGKQFDYVPLTLKLSPMYLQWDVATGTLHPLSGAQPGKVKISAQVDKAVFKDKIKLKK